MRSRPASTRRAIFLPLAAAALLLAGCGKTAPRARISGGGPLRALAPVEAAGTVSVTTRNTTRVGGASPVVDAASVARVVYPGLTRATRPQTVVIAEQSNFPAALSAATLAAAPLNAPLLYAEDDTLPPVSREALEAMHPTGSGPLGVQVLEVGTDAPLPRGYTARSIAAGYPAATAVQVERLLVQAAGTRPEQVIVLDTEGQPAMQMPAPGLAAESGAPLLLTGSASLPPATASELRLLHRPSIYVMDGSSLSHRALGELARLGRVTQIPVAAAGEAPRPATAALAAARYTDGSFGWGVKEPGHGLVFASSRRPLDAPASALLSATGDYGPLLLLEAPSPIEPALAAYLSDIQPAYTSAPEFRPVRGVYNHGWLIGDERAIALATQAQIDSLLEISPRGSGGAEAAVTQSE